MKKNTLIIIIIVIAAAAGAIGYYFYSESQKSSVQKGTDKAITETEKFGKKVGKGIEKAFDN